MPCSLRRLPSLAEVFQRGLSCMLLLIAIYVAAWNKPAVDNMVLHDVSSGKKRKREAELKHVSDLCFLLSFLSI